MRALVIVLAIVIYSQNSYAKDIWRLEPAGGLLAAQGPGGGSDAGAVAWSVLRGTALVAGTALTAGFIYVWPLAAAPRMGTTTLLQVDLSALAVVSLIDGLGAVRLGVPTSWASWAVGNLLGFATGALVGGVMAATSERPLVAFSTGFVGAGMIASPIWMLVDPFSLVDGARAEVQPAAAVPAAALSSRLEPAPAFLGVTLAQGAF